MVTGSRRLVRAGIAAAVAVVVAGLVGTAGADDLDDGMAALRTELAAVKQDEYEKIFGDRMAKLGQLPFRDQTYGVPLALSKETGWSAPAKPYIFKPSMAGGPVYWATWSSGKKAEAQPTVVVLVTRYVHSDGKGPAKTKVGDADVANSDVLALVKAMSTDWANGLEKPPAPAAGTPADGTAPAPDPAAKEAEADRQGCVDAVKKANGVASVFAARQGRLTATKKRERREWFGWAGDDATWVVCVRYDESVLSKTNAALTKGLYFISGVHVYKGVSAK